MISISHARMKKAKDFIFRNGRLLERKLFEYFFENGTKQACIRALRAYQNADGGFGNGIEPDIVCPDSTAIGAETALYILEILECRDVTIIDSLAIWVIMNQNKEGFIPHPPQTLMNYPHQPWWENPDNERIFVLAGFLKRLGVRNTHFFKKVRKYYVEKEIPEKLGFYDYPYLVYLKYCAETRKDREALSKMVNQLPDMLEENKNHYPLFSRYWFHAVDYCKTAILEREAQRFKDGFREDGAVEIPYQDLPWWRPIFTLDGLILLKKFSFV